VGDPVYIKRVPSAAKGVDQPLRGELLDFPRQALHAASLGFAHPRTGTMISFKADIPADMATLINTIDGRLSAS
jgi:23S rRNA pseudouridine1911/1915/1917 synthase